MIDKYGIKVKKIPSRFQLADKATKLSLDYNAALDSEWWECKWLSGPVSSWPTKKTMTSRWSVHNQPFGKSQPCPRFGLWLTSLIKTDLLPPGKHKLKSTAMASRQSTHNQPFSCSGCTSCLLLPCGTLLLYVRNLLYLSFCADC